MKRSSYERTTWLSQRSELAELWDSVGKRRFMAGDEEGAIRAWKAAKALRESK